MLHRKGYNLIYWTKDSSDDMVNIGDYIGQIYFNKANITSNPDGKPCFITGSLLADYWRKQFHNPIVVWGTGSIGYDFPIMHPKDEILAVRGPLTQKWLKLPETPQGDPALLLPRVYQPKITNYGPIKVFNFKNHRLGCSTRVNKWAWQGIVQTIAGAEIVLANTLHASILAQAYKRPWAVFQPNQENQFPLRWNDWFAYLNLPQEAFQPVKTFQEGYNWWDKWSKYINEPNLQPLVDCCPWPEIRKLLS